MRKYRSYIFLGALTVVFLIAGYIVSGEGGNKKTQEFINTADSLVKKVDPPEFQKAFSYMDSCLIKDPALYDDTTFRQKYDRLKTITKIK